MQKAAYWQSIKSATWSLCLQKYGDMTLTLAPVHRRYD